MKKTSMILGCVLLAVCFVFGTASAETKLLKGVVVSATCNVAKKTAVIKADGMKVEFYNYQSPVTMDSPATVDLNDGRRFTVVDGEGVYALLTPDMKAYPPDFFGPGVGLDCGNPNGCAFLITCQGGHKK